MGVPKSSLQLGSATFLELIAGAASDAFDEVVIVARRETQVASALRTIVDEMHDDAAPIFGVQRALADASGRCWIVGCDYPLLTPEVFRFFRETFEDDGELLVPRWENTDQMLCAGYSTSLLPRIERAITDGNYSLREVAASSDRIMLAERSLFARFPTDLFINVNTPADYERAKEIFDGRRRSAIDASR